jgi:class 3 adenylate cyclase
VEPPETRYAKNEDGLSIAYQTLGDGPLDLVVLTEWASHVRAAWEMPSMAKVYRRLASFSRLILFDRRGTGMSDPVPPSQLGTLEERMDDVRVVLDAAGSERAAVFATSTGAPMALVFAATYPERTSALVLFNATARALRDDDYRLGIPEDVYERGLATMPWGQDSSELKSPELSPDIIGRARAEPSDDDLVGARDALEQMRQNIRADPEFRRAHRAFQQQAASPGIVKALNRIAFHDDARHALGLVQAPTLVVFRAGSLLRVGHSRYMAEHISDARFVELDGEGWQWFVGDTDALVDEMQEFLTGVRPIAETDRVLATVMFTDIVDSTAKAASLGDARWKTVLDEHDALVRRQLERFRGRYVNTTGDGIVATFDGPARAVRCAQAICEGVRGIGIEVRAGLHTGEVELRGDDIGGISVNIGQRVSALAQPGEVLVSRTVTDLVAGSGIVFEERGEHELKGVPGRWTIYAVTT